MLNVFSIINDDTPYTIQENIIHFILHDSEKACRDLGFFEFYKCGLYLYNIWVKWRIPHV